MTLAEADVSAERALYTLLILLLHLSEHASTPLKSSVIATDQLQSNIHVLFIFIKVIS